MHELIERFLLTDSSLLSKLLHLLYFKARLPLVLIVITLEYTFTPNTTLDNTNPNFDPLNTEPTTNDDTGIQRIDGPIAQIESSSTEKGYDGASAGVQEVIGFMQRRLRVSTISWPTTAASGALLTAIDPLRQALNNPVLRSKLAGYRYIRTNAKVRFQVSGNMNFGGKLRAMWIPLNRVGEMTMWPSFFQVTGTPYGVDIYPTSNGTYEITVPQLLPRRYFDLNMLELGWNDVDPNMNIVGPNPDLISLGLIALYVINPIQGATPASTANITIFVELCDFEIGQGYSNVVYPTNLDVKVPMNYSQRSATAGNHADHVVAIRAMARTPRAREDHNDDLILGVAEAVDKAYNTFRGAVRNVGNVVGDVLHVGGTIADTALPVAALINLDKPRDHSTPVQMLPEFKDLTHSDGLEQAVSLGLKFDNRVSPICAEMMATSTDNDIASLCAIEQLFAVRKIDTTLESGMGIWQWAVAPWNTTCSAPVRPNVGQGAVGLVDHNYTSYLAQMFAYWTGTAVVRVEVVGSAFTKIGIGMCWQPGTEFDRLYVPDSTTSVSDSSLAMMRNDVFMVDGSGSHTFEVPFLSSEYVLNCDVNLTNSASGQIMPSVNGLFKAYIVNPLTNNTVDSAIQPVHVNFYVSWRDMKFYRLQGHAMCNAPQGTRYAFAASAADPDQILGSDTDGVIPLQKAATVSIDTTNLFGESIDNIADIIRRPSYLGSYIGTDPERRTLVASVFSHFPLVLPTVAPDCIVPGTEQPYVPRPPLASANFMSFLSRMFLVWRGEVTYTLINYDEGGGSDRTSTEMSGFFMTSCLDRSVVTCRDPGIQPGSTIRDFARIPAQKTSHFTNTFGTGASYRPEHVPNMPQSVVVPYYTSSPFHYTPGLWPNVNGVTNRYFNYVNTSVPALRAQTNHIANQQTYVYQVLAAAGDNFRMSIPFPPQAATLYIAPGLAPISVELHPS